MDTTLGIEQGIFSWRRHRDALRRVGRVLLISAYLAGCGGGDDDGQEDSAHSTTTTTNLATPSVTYPEPGPRILLPGEEHVEVQQFGADTFVNPSNLSGVGPRLPIGAEVIVDCVETIPI